MWWPGFVWGGEIRRAGGARGQWISVAYRKTQRLWIDRKCACFTWNTCCMQWIGRRRLNSFGAHSGRLYCQRADRRKARMCGPRTRMPMMADPIADRSTPPAATSLACPTSG